MISPTGDVWLGHVPWNNNYRDVYLEGMNNKQIILNTFMTMHTTNYTYIREDTNIRVPYNADSLYGINYCMYQNDGMWFCAFVNTITYVSNNTALLHLEEDVWHTWGGSITWNACLVAREHVLSDDLGEWRAPEPAMSLESVVIRENDFNIVPDMVVVATNAIPKLKSGVSGTIFDVHSEDDFDGNTAVAGSLNGRIYSGARYYGFSTANMAPLSNFLNNLNMAGAAESVCSMFMASSQFLSVGNDHRISGLTQNVQETISAPQSLGGGYVPRNKKCLTFPYTKINIVDNRGGVMELKCEDCDSWGSLTANLSTGLDPAAEVFFQPSDYMGLAGPDQSHIMPVAATPQCPWVYSAYQNWVAQNAEIIENKNTINFLGVLSGAGMVAIGGLLFASGAGAPAGGGLAALGLTTAEAAGLGMGIAGTSKMIGSRESQWGLEAEIDYQEKNPNITKGSSSNNALQGISRNCGGYQVVALQRQSAQRLDMFFDVFGYQVDMVKVPNYSGRARWNYVKTVGANMAGNIPSDRLALINRCLDGGITFWHTVDVGDYGYANPINGG